MASIIDWKPRHDELIRRHWVGTYRKADPTRVTMGQLATLFDVPLKAVYARAAKLGLSQPQKRTLERSDVHAFVRDRNAAGWLDSEIAEAWTAAHPDASLDRRSVCDVRRRFGLAPNCNNERHRERVRQRTVQQLAAAGLSSLADVRAAAYRQFATQRGWPAYLRVRHVQILDLLYERGPHTREEIAVAIGWRVERGQRTWLASIYGRGSYLADLLAAGFVVRSPRREVRAEARGKSVFRYYLAAQIVRRDPTTWPDEEQAIGQIYGAKQGVSVSGSAAGADAGRADVPDAAAGRGGGQGRRGGRRGNRGRDRAACEGRRQARD